VIDATTGWLSRYRYWPSTSSMAPPPRRGAPVPSAPSASVLNVGGRNARRNQAVNLIDHRLPEQGGEGVGSQNFYQIDYRSHTSLDRFWVASFW